MATSSKLGPLSAVAIVSWLLLLGVTNPVSVRANGVDDVYNPDFYDNQCSVCVSYTFMPPPAALAYPPNGQFFRGLHDDIFFQAWTNVTKYMGSAVTRWGDLLADFGDGGRGSDYDEIYFCAIFTSNSTARRYKSVLFSGAKKVATEVFCPAVPNAYGFNVKFKEPNALDAFDDRPSCFPMNVNVTCKPTPLPFPRARCNKTPGTTRLAVTANFTEVVPGRTNDTRLHCFNITAVQPNATVPSNCSSNKLSRVEIWADDSKRAFVTGLRVTRNGGTPVWGPPAWGAVRDNALKVGAPLLSNWSMTDAIGGQICIEASEQIGLGDLCLGGAGRVANPYLAEGFCFLSLFNDKDACCPTFGLELPEQWSYGDGYP